MDLGIAGKWALVCAASKGLGKGCAKALAQEGVNVVVTARGGDALEAIDKMAGRGFGRVVNITSGAVKAPIDVLGLSNGARSGLTGFVAGLARSRIAAQGVTINGLLPGVFDTDRIRSMAVTTAQKEGRTVEAILDVRRRGVPSQRLGTADEFGAICAFLCSVHAGYINGQNILADGGMYPGTF